MTGITLEHVAELTTINAETAEIAEIYWLSGLSEFCVHVVAIILKRTLSWTLSLQPHSIRPETTAQANNSERRVANVSREIASRAQKSPQVGRDRETCGNQRQVAPEPGPPARHPRWGGDAISPAVSRVRGAVVSGQIEAM